MDTITEKNESRSPKRPRNRLLFALCSEQERPDTNLSNGTCTFAMVFIATAAGYCIIAR